MTNDVSLNINSALVQCNVLIAKRFNGGWNASEPFAVHQEAFNCYSWTHMVRNKLIFPVYLQDCLISHMVITKLITLVYLQSCLTLHHILCSHLVAHVPQRRLVYLTGSYEITLCAGKWLFDTGLIIVKEMTKLIALVYLQSCLKFIYDDN